MSDTHYGCVLLHLEQARIADNRYDSLKTLRLIGYVFHVAGVKDHKAILFLGVAVVVVVVVTIIFSKGTSVMVSELELIVLFTIMLIVKFAVVFGHSDRHRCAHPSVRHHVHCSVPRFAHTGYTCKELFNPTNPLYETYGDYYPRICEGP